MTPPATEQHSADCSGVGSSLALRLKPNPKERLASDGSLQPLPESDLVPAQGDLWVLLHCGGKCYIRKDNSFDPNKPTDSTCFRDIPTELLVRVLNHAPSKSIGRALLTCQSWMDAASEQSLWRVTWPV